LPEYVPDKRDVLGYDKLDDLKRKVEKSSDELFEYDSELKKLKEDNKKLLEEISRDIDEIKKGFEKIYPDSRKKNNDSLNMYKNFITGKKKKKKDRDDYSGYA